MMLLLIQAPALRRCLLGDFLALRRRQLNGSCLAAFASPQLAQRHRRRVPGVRFRGRRIAGGGIDYGLGDLGEVPALACSGRHDLTVTCRQPGVKGIRGRAFQTEPLPDDISLPEGLLDAPPADGDDHEMFVRRVATA